MNIRPQPITNDMLDTRFNGQWFDEGYQGVSIGVSKEGSMGFPNKTEGLFSRLIGYIRYCLPQNVRKRRLEELKIVKVALAENSSCLRYFLPKRHEGCSSYKEMVTQNILGRIEKCFKGQPNIGITEENLKDYKRVRAAIVAHGNGPEFKKALQDHKEASRYNQGPDCEKFLQHYGREERVSSAFIDYAQVSEVDLDTSLCKESLLESPSVSNDRNGKSFSPSSSNSEPKQNKLMVIDARRSPTTKAFLSNVGILRTIKEEGEDVMVDSCTSLASLPGIVSSNANEISNNSLLNLSSPSKFTAYQPVARIIVCRSALSGHEVGYAIFIGPNPHNSPNLSKGAQEQGLIAQTDHHTQPKKTHSAYR